MELVGQARDRVTRRRFLAKSGAAAFGAGLSLLGFAGCAAVATYRGALVNGRIVVDTTLFPELAAPGGAILVEAEGNAAPLGPFFLLSLDGGAFRALSAVCTHLGCRVRSSGHFLRCPCHGSTYDLDGHVVWGPARRPLDLYRTRAAGGIVEIAVGG